MKTLLLPLISLSLLIASVLCFTFFQEPTQAFISGFQQSEHEANEQTDATPPDEAYFQRKYHNPHYQGSDHRKGLVDHYWKKHFSSTASLRTSAAIDWRELGPTNVGGRTRSIQVDVTNSNHVVAGGVRGGLWTTQNQGQSWTHIEGITGSESITWITQHPTQPNNWYATTGEFVGNGANFYGGGLLYSRDNAATWEVEYYQLKLNDSLNEYAYVAGDGLELSSADYFLGREGYPFQYSSRILINPITQTTFVATHGWGIMRSTDSIQSFTHSLPVLPPRLSNQLLPVDSSTTLLLRFEDNLLGEQGEIPLNTPSVPYDTGVLGKGAIIDTFDVLEYASSGNFNSQQGTLEMWIQPEWQGNDDQENVLMEIGAWPDAMLIHRVGNEIEIIRSNGSGNFVNAGSSVASWQAEEWHHVAFTWEENNSVSTYFDGVLVATNPAGSFTTITGNIRFGNPFGDGIGGVIDELRLSNRARSPQEINQSFQYGNPEPEIEPMFPAYRPQFSDISINSQGELVAFLSGQRNQGAGLYYSTDDGITWTDITPADWPTDISRGLVSYAPSNPDIAYAFVRNQDDHLYHVDFADTTIENRSANLPTWSEMPNGWLNGGSILTGDYYFVLSVKPDDEDFVAVGGVYMGRSYDGFTTLADTGYIHAIISNTHVDQHIIHYDPNSPNQAWVGNDGGLYFTDDITRIRTDVVGSNYINVDWQDKNNGYNVTQFYSVGQSNDPLDHRVAGGAQDNGFLAVKPFDPKEPNRAFGDDFGSDGGYVYVTPGFTYMSFQGGETYKLKTEASGEPSFAEWTKISPSGADRQFIHPWAVDPNEENTMYYPIQDKMYRIDDIDEVPPFTDYGESNYDLISDGSLDGYDFITTVSVAEEPAHTLFFAAQSSQGNEAVIKRVRHADSPSPIIEDVSFPTSENWYYVNCIEPHPQDSNEWLVVLTNYDIPGLYHTTDAGQSYQLVEGNLAGSDSIPGPSMEWADILIYEGETYYFLATHIGVFMTQVLEGANTVWEHQGDQTIGYSLALMVRSRAVDGKVVVGTHGRGFFGGFLSEPLVSGITKNAIGSLELSAFPISDQGQTRLRFELEKQLPLRVEIVGLNGQIMYQERARVYPAGSHQTHIPMQEFPAGVYIAHLYGEGYQGTTKLLWR